jgi:hypothetical protein
LHRSAAIEAIVTEQLHSTKPLLAPMWGAGKAAHKLYSYSKVFFGASS